MLAWTVESLASKGIEYVRTGLFGQVQKEIYQVDGHTMDTFEAGSSSVERYMVLPLEAYQTLQESDGESASPGCTNSSSAPTAKSCHDS